MKTAILSITGTWVAEDTVDVIVVGSDPVAGQRTQTYTLAESDGQVEGTYDLVITTSSGVFLSEKELDVTGSYAFPDVTLIVHSADGSARITRRGTMDADGEAMEFPPDPEAGGPLILQRQ